MLFFLIVLIYQIALIHCDCTSVTAPDGTTYDQLNMIPTVTGVDPSDNFKWTYSINLCTPLPQACDVCVMDAGYCQVSPSRQTIFCVGSAYPNDRIVGLNAGKGVLTTFTSPPDKGGTVRIGIVTVNCNPNALTPQNIMIHNPNDPTGYRASWESAYACPSVIGCAATSSDGHSYSQLKSIQTVNGSDPNDSFKWIFTVNICSPLSFPCDVCGSSAGYCQQSPSKQTVFCVGSSYPDVSITGLVGGAGIMAEFKSPPDANGYVRRGNVTVNCSPGAFTPQNVVILTPTNPTGYFIIFDSAFAC